MRRWRDRLCVAPESKARARDRLCVPQPVENQGLFVPFVTAYAWNWGAGPFMRG